MLAMGKALMLEPSLLLLDEPSAALSPILVTQVFEQIKQINQGGTAIVLVEQVGVHAIPLGVFTAAEGVVLIAPVTLQHHRRAVGDRAAVHDALDKARVGRLDRGKRHFFVADARLKRVLPRIFLASVIMGVVLWAVAGALDGMFKPPTPELMRALALTVLVGAGFLAYAVAVFATGALDMRQLRSFLRRRTPPPGPL